MNLKRCRGSVLKIFNSEINSILSIWILNFDF